MANQLSRLTDLINDIKAKLNTMTPRLLPRGGTAGQVVVKNSATDYDFGVASLGSAATANTGTAGHAVPYLDATANTWTNGATFGGAISATNLSGTNTGDQTTITGNAGSASKLATARTIAATGDITWSGTFDGTAGISTAATLATVNSGPGTFGSASGVPVITVDGKGRVSAISTAALGTAATATIGTSGATVPLLSTANTWALAQTFTGAINASNFTGTSSGTNTGDQTSVTGNAGTATKLATARTLSVTGDGTWSMTFDGSGNATGTSTLATTGVVAGTYGAGQSVPQITVDAKGRVTGATTVAIGNTVAYNIGTSGATVPLLSGVNSWGAAQTFNGGFNAAASSFTGSAIMYGGRYQVNDAGGTGNGFWLYNSSATTDTKYWRIYGSGTSGSNNLVFDAMNDAANAASTWMTVARSGYSPTNINMVVPVSLNSSLYTTGFTTAAGGLTVGSTMTVNTSSIVFNGGSSGATVGYSCSTGVFLDGSNVGLRTYGSNSIYFQNASGAITYGRIGSDKLDLTVPINHPHSQWLTSTDGISRIYLGYNDRTYINGNNGLTFRINQSDQLNLNGNGSITQSGQVHYFNNNGGQYVQHDGNQFFVAANFLTPTGRLNLTVGQNHQSQEGGFRFRYDSGGSTNYGAPNGYHYFQSTDGSVKASINGDGSMSIKGPTFYVDGNTSGGSPGHYIQNQNDRFGVNCHFDVMGNYVFASYFNQSSGANENPAISQFIVDNGDGYHRKAGKDYVYSQLANASGGHTDRWYFTSNANTSDGQLALNVYSNNGGGAGMSFHRGGNYAVNMGLDSDNVFRMGGFSASNSRLQMDMSGNLTMAGDVTAFSDIKFKANVRTIDNALAKVCQMRGVTFNRIDQNMRPSSGVIAQEFETVAPELVREDNEGTKSVVYGNTLGYLIEAIKEVSARLENLEGHA